MDHIQKMYASLEEGFLGTPCMCVYLRIFYFLVYCRQYRKSSYWVVINPIPGGVWSHPIPGGCAILHTPTNFWTTDDTELKFYMVIDIHKLFPKIEKKLGWKC